MDAIVSDFLKKGKESNIHYKILEFHKNDQKMIKNWRYSL